MDYMLCMKEACQVVQITYLPEAVSPIYSLAAIFVFGAMLAALLVVLHFMLEKKKKRMALLQQKLKLTNEEYELLRGTF